MAEIVHIGIADRCQVEPVDYKDNEDPELFQSIKDFKSPCEVLWGPDGGGIWQTSLTVLICVPISW